MQFIMNYMELIAFWASVFAAIAGFSALIVVEFAWSWLGRHYQESWAKCAVAVFRAIAALSAIAARPVPLQPDKSFWEQPWASTITIAITGYLLWEIAGARGDQKYKRGKEKTAEDHKNEIRDLKEAHKNALATATQEVDVANQDREDAEFEALRLGRLLTHLRKLVSEKRQRVRRVVLEAVGTRVSIQQVRLGLNPDEHVRILLVWLASLLHLEAVHADSRRYNQNFRVGLFADRNGMLVPLEAFDFATRSPDPFSAYEQHADRFRIDNDTNPSHAVRCVREGRTLIVGDCTTEAEFEFFDDRQRNYLRSMVAHPLIGFCPDGINPARAALLIDTDVPGFFREDDREMLELLLKEFAARIDLEYAISRLTG